MELRASSKRTLSEYFSPFFHSLNYDNKFSYEKEEDKNICRSFRTGLCWFKASLIQLAKLQVITRRRDETSFTYCLNVTDNAHSLWRSFCVRMQIREDASRTNLKASSAWIYVIFKTSYSHCITWKDKLRGSADKWCRGNYPWLNQFIFSSANTKLSQSISEEN